MSRRNARENAIKIVYETGVCGEINELTVGALTEELNEDEKAYFDKTIYGVAERKEQLENIIRKYARAYEFDRLYKVDIAILIVAIYEILYLDNIPYKVSVNEAVEIAKAYSTEKSASYINGILASVIKDMEQLK